MIEVATLVHAGFGAASSSFHALLPAYPCRLSLLPSLPVPRYTVEFGVVREGGGVKAFGAGVLSSFGELQHMAAGRAELVPLDVSAPLPRMSYKCAAGSGTVSVHSELRNACCFGAGITHASGPASTAPAVPAAPAAPAAIQAWPQPNLTRHPLPIPLSTGTATSSATLCWTRLRRALPSSRPTAARCTRTCRMRCALRWACCERCSACAAWNGAVPRHARHTIAC